MKRLELTHLDRTPAILRASLLALVLASGCDSSLSSKASIGGAAFPGFVVDAVIPPNGAIEVGRDSQIELAFSQTIDRSSLGEGLADLDALIVLEELDAGMNATRVVGSYALEDNDTRIVFRPDAPLSIPEVLYRLSVFPGMTDIFLQELDLDDSPVLLPSFFTSEPIVDVIPPVFAGIAELRTLSSSTLRSTWTSATDDQTPDLEITYQVYRNDPPAQPDVDYLAPVVITDPGATEALITGLLPGTEYTVGVRALDSFGNESGNIETRTTSTETLTDATPPVFSGIASVTTLSTRELEANWTAASDDFDDPANIRYNVYLAADGSAVDFSQPFFTTPGGATIAVLGSLDSATNYSVVVRALDTTENEDTNTAALEARTLVSFSQNVFPILTTPSIGNCSSRFCHNRQRPNGPTGGLVLETYDGLIAGGRNDNPNAVEPNDGAGSRIIWRIDTAGPDFLGPKMPSGRPELQREQIDIIRLWIDEGALNELVPGRVPGIK